MTQVLGWEPAGFGLAAAIVSAVVAAIFLIKLNLYREILLSAFSFILCSLLIFGLVELFPSLARSFHLTSIHYYALRERYVTDDTLVFRVRPFYELQEAGYKGDLYSPTFGLDVPEIPYEAEFDKNGFRNVTGEREADVVVLGDSFIEVGETDADLFSVRLERLSGLRTTNLGFSWYGPFQYLEVLKRYGVEKNPRYVIFSFFEGNDLKDIREYMRWINGGDYYHFNLTSKGLWGRYRLALREVAQHVTGMVSTRGTSRAVQDKGAAATTSPDLVDLKLGDAHYKVRFGYKNETADTAQIVLSDEWKEFRKILMELRALCADHQIVPLLMFIPTKAHIYADYSTELSGISWIGERQRQIAAKDNLRDAIVGISNELHIQLIDLTPVFAARAKKGELVYYPFDTHWNQAGREAAAKIVAQSLASLHGVAHKARTL